MHCTHDWWFFFKRLILRLLSFKIIACTLFKSNYNHGVIAYKNVLNAPLFVLAHILLECNCQLLSKRSITFCKRKDREIT